MLSYQHTYHAGCFADVIKHLTLSNILQYMVQKDKPILYLDTHSGRGLYDLKHQHALKTQEAVTGIETLWNIRKKLPDAFAPYLSAITAMNPDHQLRYYPGSPALALRQLRTQDRLIFCELHPSEYDHLKDFTPHRQRVHCMNDNGYHQIQALLPPKERRGLIMIDPSYEIKNEYKHVTQAVQSALQLFATGVYCIWYPIVDNKLHSQLIRGFSSINADKQLRAEFYLNTKSQYGMQGCGLWIINPPFQLHQQLRVIFEILRTVFHPGKSSYLLE